MRSVKITGKQKTGKYEYPRLTLTGELEQIGVKPDEEVLIEIAGDTITIRPLRSKEDT